MKVKAILWRWPGGGRRPRAGTPTAGRGSLGRRHPPSLVAWPSVPLCRVWRTDLTGPPRPQPGRERKAAPGAAAAGPSDQLGQFSRPLLPERSRALRRSGRGPGRGRR